MSPYKTSLLIAALLAAYPAVAQTTPAVSDADAAASAATVKPAGAKATQVIETVVVTARRINERLQDVPISIVALTAKDIEDRGINSISDLSLFTPGLSYSPDFGRTAERPVIRGISALRNEAPQPVSVFIDGIFVRDAALGLAIDDAQHVEVIKGPQSALYGRSTYAGAINYITKKPTGKLSGKVSVTAATDNERTVFGAVTVPILPDLLSVRVRARHYEFGGQYTNSQTGNKIGNERTNAGGITALLTPTDNFEATLTLDTSRDRDGLFAATIRTVPLQAGGVVTSQNGSSNLPNGSVCNGRTINIVGNNAAGLPDAKVPASATTKANGWTCGPSTFAGTVLKRNELDLANYTDPLTGANYGNIAGLEREVQRGSLTLNYGPAGGMTLTSQTAVTRQRSNVGADQSYSGVQFAPAFLGGTAWLSYDRDKLEYVSQEFRFASAQNQALTWLGGLFYYKEDGEGLTGNGVIAKNSAGAVIAAPQGLSPKSASHVTNLAPFGRVQYAFDPTLRVSLEARYSSEQVKVGGTPLGTAIATVGTCVAGQVCSIKGDRTFKSFDPRLTVDYKPNADTLLYGQYATGSKSGGFNTTPGLTSDVFSYDGEKVKSLEVGAKTQLAGGSVLFNVALFRNEISGLQLSNISSVVNPFNGATSTTTIVNNVGKARTQGFETELQFRATQWLTLSGNYAYTDAKALQGTEVTNGTVFGGNSSVAGFTLPRSPKHSIAASAAVELPVGGDGLRMQGRLDVVHQSRRYAEIQNMIWADPFTRVNASAVLRGKQWRATLFVRNADNDNTSLNGFRYADPSTFRRTAVDFLPKLRQYGVTVAYDF